MTVDNKPRLIEIGGQSFNGSLKYVEEALRFRIQFKAKKASKNERVAAFKGFNSYEDASRWINNNRDLSIHEVTRCGYTGSIQRLFLDIDYKRELKDSHIHEAYYQLVESVSEVLSAAGINNHDRIKLDGSHASKFGIHDIYKFAYIDTGCYGCFCSKLTAVFKRKLEENGIPSKYAEMIDDGVYSRHHTLRVHLSPKPENTGNAIYKIEGSEEANKRFDYKTLITYMINPQEDGGRVEIYECGADCLRMKSSPINSLPGNLSDKMKTAEAELLKLSDKGISIRNHNGNFINLYADHELPCYVCDKKHENENPICVVNEGYAVILCRRSKDANGKYARKLLVRFEEFKRYESPKAIEIASGAIAIPELFIETESRRIEGLTKRIEAHNTLYVNSDLDTGKSYAFINHMRDMVKINSAYSCVIVTYRVNLAYEIFAKNYIEQDDDKAYMFENYQTLPNGLIKVSQHPRIIIQYESLNRLVLDDDVNLTFIDEGASLLQQTQSGLNKSKAGLNLSQFDNLLNSTKKLLICDALMSIETMQTFEILRGDVSAAFWLNKSEPWSPTVQYIEDVSDWRDQLITELVKGAKIYVTTTRGEVTIRALADQIKSVCGEKFPILCIYGGGENNADIMGDINNELVKFSCVIASPCMSAGVSFDVKDHFDKVYSFVGNDGPTLVDIIQSLRRVRHIKSNEVVICDLTNELNIPSTLDDMIEYEEKRLYHNSEEYITHGISIKTRGVKSLFNNISDRLFRFVISAKKEINRARKNIKGGLRDFFERQNAQFKNTIKREEAFAEYRAKERKVFAGFKKAVRSDINDVIAKAPIIDDDEYNEIKKLKRLTAEKRAKLEKYQLARTYGLGCCYNLGKRDLIEGTTILNDPDRIGLLNNPSIIDMYHSAKYRDLSNEDVAKIDSAKMASLTDIEKLGAKFRLAKHIVINEIIKIVNGGQDVKTSLMAYLRKLKNEKNPVVTEVNKITDKDIIKTCGGLIRAYGYAIEYSKQDIRTGTYDVEYKITDIISDIFNVITSPVELLFFTPNSNENFKPLIYIESSNSIVGEGAD